MKNYRGICEIAGKGPGRLIGAFWEWGVLVVGGKGKTSVCQTSQEIRRVSMAVGSVTGER